MSNVPQNDRGCFTCSICSREFSGINSLRKHIPIHSRRIQHRCDICGHVFGKREYLLDHVRTHTGEISPVCGVCKQTFSKSLKLKEHMKQHKNLNADGSVHEILPYRCHVCREVFQLAAVLGNHLSTSHPSETANTVKCERCPATFADVRAKNHHVYSEHQAAETAQQKSVWCPVCNQGFTRHYNLKVHMYKAHGKEYVENNFSSAEGKANGKQASTKNSHYFDEKKGTQVLSCQFCALTFLRKSDLTIHLEHIHHLPVQLVPGDSGEPPSITINPIKRRASDGHQSRQAEKRRRPGPASRTNAPEESRNGNGVARSSTPSPSPSLQSSNIPAHLLNVAQLDAGSSGYKCQECGKVLQHKQSFLSHMKVIHGNFYGGNKWKGSSVVDMILEESSKISPRKRPNRSGPDANATICSVCESVFPNPSSLRNHVVNVHINGSAFACDLCGKAFLNQENLDAHTKSKHPNLTKRLQSLREALGLSPFPDNSVDGKTMIVKAAADGSLPPDINDNTLPSDAISSSTSTNAPPTSSSTTVELSLSGSTPSSLSLSSSSVTPVVVEVPLNLSKSSNSASSCSASPSTSRPASPLPTKIPPTVSLPSTPVPPKDLAVLPSSPLPIGEIVSGAAVNNNNEGEGPTVIPTEEGGAGSGDGSGRKKNSICKVCGVVLSPKTNVNVHMRTHSGARPYQCVLCLNRFRQKAHLMKHFRCSHNQKRPPFVCLFCPEETATSNDLYRHITDKHKEETDELVRVNGIQPPPEADEVDEEQRNLAAAVMAEEEHKVQQQQAVAVAAAAMPVPVPVPVVVPAPPPAIMALPIQLPQEPEPREELAPTVAAMQKQAAEAAARQEEAMAMADGDGSDDVSVEQAQQQEQMAAAAAAANAEEDEDVRYEPITEPFLFEGQVIYPCYCILPFVSDAAVETSCKRPISVS